MSENGERISSYSSIFSMGHKALAELFDGHVVVEEKIDGSQISFGRRGSELLMRSKGQQIIVDAPDQMFEPAVEIVKNMFNALPNGVLFRGEYLKSPKHNTLAYARIPKNNIIIFDIDIGIEDYITPVYKKVMAATYGFETVPLLFEGEIKSVDQIRSLLPENSILGGAKAEGIVIKNYSKYGHDKKILMGKYVRPEFIESNSSEWRKNNPQQKDILATLIDSYKTEARWAKSVQHLRDDGKLDQSPKDIGALMKEVEKDIRKECEEEIKDKLWKWAWPHIARGAKGGLPEWYKNKLLEECLKPTESLNDR